MNKISCYLILLLVVGAVISADGQITRRDLLSGKYDLAAIRTALVARDKWKPFPQTAAEWKDRVPTKELDAIVKRAEQVLGREIPQVTATLMLEYVRNGNRSNYQEKSFARRNELMDLVLAESVEDKGRFSDAIANYVWAICEETYWGVPAHLSVQRAKNGLPDVDDPTVDLFGAETVATLALADYFVGPKLDKVSPLLRKRIYTEANRKIFEPVKQQNRYSWIDPAKKVNNWDPWIMSNLIIAELMLEPDDAKRSENVHRYMQYLDVYINGLGEDGGCDEGPSYWFAAGGSVFDSLEMLQSATNNKAIIYDQPIIQKMASYIYKMHIADSYFVDFADADPKFSGDGLMLYRFGDQIRDDKLTAFGQYLYSRNSNAVGEGFMKPRRIFNLLTLKQISASRSTPYIPSPEAWFSDIQTLTARTSSGLFLATHAGNNDESHNHNDIGDFIVYLGNEPVIVDAGRGNYTAKTFSSKRYDLWFTQSQYHNLPIVNGFGQLAGKQYMATAVKQETTGQSTSLEMDIAKAYPADAGITTWKRKVTLDRSNDTVSIVDDYALRSALSSLQQVFMTACNVDISLPGKLTFTAPKGKVVTLSYDPNAWSAATDRPSTEGPEYSSFSSKWDNHPITRIVLTAEAPRSSGQFSYRIAVKKT